MLRVDESTLLHTLGLARPAEDRPVWSGRENRRAPLPEQCTFIVVFNRPIDAGVVAWNGTPQAAKAWLVDADSEPAATDARPVLDSDQWVDLPTPRMDAGTSVAAVPAGQAIRAIMLVDNTRRRSHLRDVRLYAPRLHDVTPHAIAYANKERYVDPYMSSPYYHKAMWVVWGSGEWQNTGQNKEGRIDDPPVSDVHPAWFMLTWEQEQTIAAVQLVSNFEEFEVDVFEGPDGVNPRAAISDEWRQLRGVKQSGAWLAFEPVTTRGLRVRITKTRDGPVASIAAMRAYVDLRGGPVPAPLRHADEPSPVQFDVDVPQDGTLTIAIDDEAGNRVRNLIAIEPVQRGIYRAQWDLRDMDGVAVRPGRYTWKAISAPPLELHYQMTPYPNVRMFTDTNTPWLNGHDGTGGWMADHTPTHSVATEGDDVYMGATVPESGVSLIETDLDGVKRWGHHSFEAWTGPRFLAADKSTVYAAAWTCRLWAIDRERHHVRSLGSLPSTNSRLRKVTSIEAHDATLYLAHRVPEPWLVNAATAADVDMEETIPRYRVPREPTRPHQFVTDYRTNFLGLLRLTRFPPGQHHSTLSQLVSQGGTTSKQHLVVPFHKPIAIGSAIFPQPSAKDVRVRLSVLKADAAYPPNPGREADWAAFDAQAKAPWDVAAAPPGTVTRALRITFLKGEDDIFSADNNAGDFDHGKLLDEGLDRLDDASGLLGGRENWIGQLDGIKLLRRRYVNVFPQAEVRVSSGTHAADGAWDARRDKPLTRDDPAVYLMQWDDPQRVRGLAFKEVDAKTVLIDVWEGDAPPPDDITSGEHWREVAAYEQRRRRFQNFATHERNEQARYVDGYAPFENEVITRAIRLRFVEQWVDNGDKGQYGVREDRGGLEIDTTRCRMYGVAVMQPLGGEREVEPVVYERIEAFDAATKTIVGEVHVPHVGGDRGERKGRLVCSVGQEHCACGHDRRSTHHRGCRRSRVAACARGRRPRQAVRLRWFAGATARARVRRVIGQLVAHDWR